MRKQVMKLIISLILLITILPLGSAEANIRTLVTINGQFVRFDGQGAIIADGRTLVPIRGVFESLGFTVGWDATLSQATLTRSDAVIVIRVGEDTFTTNGTEYNLDVPAQTIGGRVLLPIRAVLESVNHSLQWDANANTVRIETPFGRLPNRRKTGEEVQGWINEYHLLGGVHAFELEVVRLVNIERANVGASPLMINDTLMMAARFKSQEMSNLRYFSHSSPVYGDFTAISRQLFGLGASGENLAAGHESPAAVVIGWMNSPGHRENMLSSGFTEIGVGFYESYWTQKFR